MHGLVVQNANVSLIQLRRLPPPPPLLDHPCLESDGGKLSLRPSVRPSETGHSERTQRSGLLTVMSSRTHSVGGGGRSVCLCWRDPNIHMINRPTRLQLTIIFPHVLETYNLITMATSSWMSEQLYSVKLFDCRAARDCPAIIFTVGIRRNAKVLRI